MKLLRSLLVPLGVVLLLCFAGNAGAADGKKKIVFLAGAGSHGFGSHAHNAGCQLLAKALNEAMPDKLHAVVSRGWPSDATVLDGAAAIVIYCDGGRLLNEHLAELDALMKKGTGLACLHYTVDPGKKETMDKMRDWIGGCYEQHWSINPSWIAKFEKLPAHPVARGVKPFRIHDEWYCHMRFRENMEGVTPILSAVPPDSTRKRPDGPHSGNPAVRARMGMAEDVGWVYQRPDGARGFGFTGGHVHWNWAHNDFRKVVLNAIVWIARLEVPADGVPSKQPTVDDLIANQDSPMPANWNAELIQRFIDDFNKPPEPAK
ncbi:MAG: ThuA domain-containing protein [Verrucomicrobia bacterium]|nr:ThuA domain-containing protein [Verrucomicrobiota bacterium]